MKCIENERRIFKTKIDLTFWKNNWSKLEEALLDLQKSRKLYHLTKDVLVNMYNIEQKLLDWTVDVALADECDDCYYFNQQELVEIRDTVETFEKVFTN